MMIQLSIEDAMLGRIINKAGISQVLHQPVNDSKPARLRRARFGWYLRSKFTNDFTCLYLEISRVGLGTRLQFCSQTQAWDGADPMRTSPRTSDSLGSSFARLMSKMTVSYSVFFAVCLFLILVIRLVSYKLRVNRPSSITLSNISQTSHKRSLQSLNWSSFPCAWPRETTTGPVD